MKRNVVVSGHDKNKGVSIARHSAKRKRFRAKMNALMSRIEAVPCDLDHADGSCNADLTNQTRNILSIYDLLGDITHQKLSSNNLFSQQLLSQISQTQNMILSGTTTDNADPICIPSSPRNDIGVESAFKILKRAVYPVSTHNMLYHHDIVLPTDVIPTNPYQETLLSIAKEIMTQNIKYSMEPQQKYDLDKICGIKLPK